VNLIELNLTSNEITVYLDTRYFWISVVILFAGANGSMVDDFADGVAATSARVSTQSVDASSLKVNFIKCF
jgi:hypothetical protein